MIRELRDLGVAGYRHLKCYEHLTCEISFPLQARFPEMMSLCAQANFAAARQIARVVVENLLRSSDLGPDERETLEAWLAAISEGTADFHEVFLGLEEVLDSHSQEIEQEWSAEDITEELDNLIALCRAAE